MSYFNENKFLGNVFCRLLLIIVMSFCLIACHSKPNVGNVNKQIGKSNVYTKEEIENAIDVIVKQFESTYFNNCTLTDLWYDEDAAIKQQTEWAKEYKVENVIVIFSNFKTGSLSSESPLTSHTTYNNYNWILVKKGNNWEIRDQGY